jgi:hypothetical protein
VYLATPQDQSAISGTGRAALRSSRGRKGGWAHTAVSTRSGHDIIGAY